MTIGFIDGFDGYTTLSDAGWVASSGGGPGPSIAAAAARTGIAGIRVTDARDYATRLTGGSSASGVLGCAVRLPSGWGLQSIVAALGDDGATRHVDLRVDAFGRLYVTRNGTTILGPTTESWIPVNVWTYVELAYLIDDAAGTISVRVNGSVVLSGAGLDTRNGLATANVTAIQLGLPGAGVPAWQIDDLYAVFGSTAPLGDARVDYLVPGGAGTTTQWTPSAGANWQCVDEVPPNDDVDYVSTATVGQQDTYAMGNLPAAAGVVLAVQVTVRHRKDDAGTRTIVPVTRSGAADWDGAAVNPGNGYATTRQVRETDPATGAAWSVAAVNAVEIGQRLTV